MSEKNQIKSKKRVADHGEVFTAEREVKAMCDLVDTQCKNISATFLEPACGDGNFLSEILARKLEVVKKNYKKDKEQFQKQSLIAISSLYGIDILIDNVIECRNWLYDIWNNLYTSLFKNECDNDLRQSVKFILSKNIICGNSLTSHLVDEYGDETIKDLLISEWMFLDNNKVVRNDYRFKDMLEESEKEEKQKSDYQLSIFEEDNNAKAHSIKRVESYYRRLFENE